MAWIGLLCFRFCFVKVYLILNDFCVSVCRYGHMKQALPEVRSMSEIPRAGVMFNHECSHEGSRNQTLVLCKYALLPTEPSSQALFGFFVLFLLVKVVCPTGSLTQDLELVGQVFISNTVVCWV